MKRQFTCRLICISLLVVVIAGDARAQQYPYALFELPHLNPVDPYSDVRSINRVGQVSGTSRVPTGGSHAVIWNPDGTIQDLGTIEGDGSTAYDVNDQGDAAGRSTFEPGNSNRHACLWRDGLAIDLGTLGGPRSEAKGVNNLGQVVGWADAEVGGAAFIWENGQMRELPSYVQRSGVAYGINDGGQIVGRVIGESSSQWAALWENEKLVVLPHLNRAPSVAIAINDFGQIVGQSTSTGINSPAHAVAWINREIFDLHNAQLGRSSSAWGMNNVGQVVGWAGEGLINQHAMIWEQGIGMRRIIDLVPPRRRATWRFGIAHGINDAGQIAAYGFETSDPGTLIAFLVNPVSPTMQLSAPSPGRAGTSNTITLTGATPGATVQFLYSRFGGGARIPGCDLQQNALQLDSPTVIGTATADSNGVASITRTVPPVARNQIILFQAMVPGECAISQLVLFRFE